MRTILLILATVISLAAQAYEPLIREDRIWEYMYIGTTDTEIYKFKFDGTQRINSTEYHKLNCWKADEETPVIRTVALMREAGNCVYMLMVNNSLNVPNNLLSLDSDISIPSNTEAVIYNTDIFDKIIEGIPQNVLIARDYPFTASMDYFDFAYKISPVLCQKKTVEANGKIWTAYVYAEKPRFLEDLGDGFNGISYKGDHVAVYIPGIGNVNSGLPYQPWLFDRPMSGFNMKFRKVRDLYGNIIFDAQWLEGTDGVNELPETAPSRNGKSFDLNGMPVDEEVSGTVYIRDGKKHIAR